MAYRCCVPLCKKPKGDGHTLHLFPSDPHFKRVWISAISLYEEKCGRSWKYRESCKICSRHFEKDCYSITTSRKQLLPNSFPTLFDDYAPLMDTSTTVLNPKHKRRRDPEYVSKFSSKDDLQNEDTNYLAKEIESTGDDYSVYFTSEREEDEGAASKHASRPQKNKPHIIECVDYPPMRVTKDVGVQANIAKPNVTKRTYPYSSKRLIRQDRIIGRLEQKLRHLRAVISKRNVSSELAESYSKLTDALKNNDLRALFIKEQLNAFGKKKITYDVSIAEVCQLWHSESSSSYNYVRNLDVLHLPSKNTLKSFLECYSNNTVPSLIELQDCPNQLDLQTDDSDNSLLRPNILEYHPVSRVTLVDDYTD